MSIHRRSHLWKHWPGLGILLGTLFTAAAGAQEVLPFPPTPSASTPGLTIQDSTYKKRVEPRRLAEDAPNILIILMDDVGPGTPSTASPRPVCPSTVFTPRRCVHQRAPHC